MARGKVSFWTLFWMVWNAITLALNIQAGRAGWAAFSAFVLGGLFILAVLEAMDK